MGLSAVLFTDGGYESKGDFFLFTACLYNNWRRRLLLHYYLHGGSTVSLSQSECVSCPPVGTQMLKPRLLLLSGKVSGRKQKNSRWLLQDFLNIRSAFLWSVIASVVGNYFWSFAPRHTWNSLWLLAHNEMMRLCCLNGMTAFPGSDRDSKWCTKVLSSTLTSRKLWQNGESTFQLYSELKIKKN